MGVWLQSMVTSAQQVVANDGAQNWTSTWDPVLGTWAMGILFMDEILHHLRHPRVTSPLSIPTNDGFPWF